MVAGRLKRVAAVLAAAAIGVVIWWGTPRALEHLEFFRVRRVELVGVRYLTPAAVVNALELSPRASVFDDLAPLERRANRIGGVARATVRRKLPGTLVVEVAERTPVAFVPRAGRLSMIDNRGRLLPFDPTRAAPDLPLTVRPDSVVGRVLGVVREADPALYARIGSAWRIGGDVAVDLEGRRVLFGAGVSAEDIQAVTAVAQDLARRGREYAELDGRFDGQVVVRWARG